LGAIAGKLKSELLSLSTERIRKTLTGRSHISCEGGASHKFLQTHQSTLSKTSGKNRDDGTESDLVAIV
jgi:hypothetical protein